MSVGPAGRPDGIAGIPLQQSAGSADRNGLDAAAKAREARTRRAAEESAGVGRTEADEQTSMRDADGRRPWELRRHERPAVDAPGEDEATDAALPSTGRHIDLSG